VPSVRRSPKEERLRPQWMPSPVSLKQRALRFQTSFLAVDSRQIVYGPQYEVVEKPSIGFEPFEKIAAGSERRFNDALHLAPQLVSAVIEEVAAARRRLSNEQRLS